MIAHSHTIMSIICDRASNWYDNVSVGMTIPFLLCTTLSRLLAYKSAILFIAAHMAALQGEEFYVIGHAG